MTRTRLKPGDVLELAADRGRAYAQFLGRHPEFGDAVLLCPAPKQQQWPLPEASFHDGYVAFYPASAAVKQGLAKIVGTLPCPALPDRFRRAGAIDNDGHVLTWLIDTGSTTPALRYHLTEEERKIPIAEIWNHEMLLFRISQGWRPEQEG